MSRSYKKIPWCGDKKRKKRHHFFINCAFPKFLYICLWFDFNIFRKWNH